VIPHNVTSVLFIERMILKPEYRGVNLSHKIIKEVIRTFGSDDSTLVILHAAPPQQAFHDENSSLAQQMPKKSMDNIYEQFGLESFDLDEEKSKYKLYALCKSFGFKRAGDSDYFYYHTAENNPILDSVELIIENKKED
jgi:hypothetical protein